MADASRLRTNASHLPKRAGSRGLAELTDLQRDGKQEGRSSNHAAGAALPASWYAANFLVLEMGYVGIRNDF